MSRTVAFAKGSFGPTSEKEDLFNVLDYEAPKDEHCNDAYSKMDGINDNDITGKELMDFYTNSVLLITGGTGFLGRVLLQKILRTFPIKRIYLLVRKKNTQSVEERMDEFFQDLVRTTLRRHHTSPIEC